MSDIDPEIQHPEPDEHQEEHALLADALPSSGLLSFYDRLRDRIVAWVEKRGGRISSQAAQALLLVPDIFILMVRLSLDKSVPKESRVLLASGLAYFVLPIDLLPEAIVGPTGYLDDLVLGLMILSKAFGSELEPYAEKYWSGQQPVRTVLRDVLAAAHKLVGANLYDRLKDLLKRQGVDLDKPAS